MIGIPKHKREENANYRALARDKDCTLRVPGVCCFDPATTVLAHSNWHDKGGARKASDFYGVWSCYTCHSWLDSGKASQDQKKGAFNTAMKRMEKELEKIVAYQMTKAKERDAAWWALERIRAIPA
jgi:hypothetical protein